MATFYSLCTTKISARRSFVLNSKKVCGQNCVSFPRYSFLAVMIGVQNTGRSLTFLYLILHSVPQKISAHSLCHEHWVFRNKMKNYFFQNTENFFLIQLCILTRCLMSKCLLLIQLISQMLYFQFLLQVILKLGFMEMLLIMIINFKSALVMDFSPVAHHHGSSISGKTEAVIKSMKSFRVSTTSPTWAWWGLMQIPAETPRLITHSGRELVLKYCRKSSDNTERKMHSLLVMRRSEELSTILLVRIQNFWLISWWLSGNKLGIFAEK